MKPMLYGYVPSIEDDRDYIYESTSIYLPKSYELQNFVSKVENQGNKPKCVSVSISTMMEWIIGVDRGTKLELSTDFLFDNRPDKSLEGMVPSEALNMLLKLGIPEHKVYKSNNQDLILDNASMNKIKYYAKVNNLQSMKSAIIANGPVLTCMMVRDPERPEFWLGNGNYGGHAVVAVGWDNDSFIIQNSWGHDWGNSGYCKLPFDQLNHVIEAWTIIA